MSVVWSIANGVMRWLLTSLYLSHNGEKFQPDGSGHVGGDGELLLGNLIPAMYARFRKPVSDYFSMIVK